MELRNLSTIARGVSAAGLLVLAAACTPAVTQPIGAQPTGTVASKTAATPSAGGGAATASATGAVAGSATATASGATGTATPAGSPTPRPTPFGTGFLNDEVQPVVDAVLAHLRRTAPTLFDNEVAVQGFDGDWARFTVTQASIGTVLGFARKQGGAWQVVALQNGYTPQGLDQLGVPRSLAPR